MKIEFDETFKPLFYMPCILFCDFEVYDMCFSILMLHYLYIWLVWRFNFANFMVKSI